MTSNPNRTPGQVDIKPLLKLLNASEESDPASDASPEIIDEPKSVQAQRLSRLQKLANLPAQSNAGDAEAIPYHFENLSGQDNFDNEGPSDDTENRFAAHIVHGMSKLRRSEG